jgi:hypothetical protein
VFWPGFHLHKWHCKMPNYSKLPSFHLKCFKTWFKKYMLLCVADGIMQTLREKKQVIIYFMITYWQEMLHCCKSDFQFQTQHNLCLHLWDQESHSIAFCNLFQLHKCHFKMPKHSKLPSFPVSKNLNYINML